jgi:hypothetical protein
MVEAKTMPMAVSLQASTLQVIQPMPQFVLDQNATA